MQRSRVNYSKLRNLVALVLLSPLWGCNDPYGTAAKLAQDVAVAVNQADTTVDTFRMQGTITDSEERSILGYLNSLNTLDGVYIGCVQAAHANTGTVGDFTACAQTLVQAMGQPSTLAALHVSTLAGQSKVTAIAQGIVTLAQTTITALGGK
jgi:hypothetical protein